jgi:hypothetical protein
LFAALGRNALRLFIGEAADFLPRLEQGNAGEDADAGGVDTTDDKHRFNTGFHKTLLCFTI